MINQEWFDCIFNVLLFVFLCLGIYVGIEAVLITRRLRKILSRIEYLSDWARWLNRIQSLLKCKNK